MKKHNCRIGNACELCAEEDRAARRAEFARDLIDAIAVAVGVALVVALVVALS